jgi:hypothetical protein
MHVSLSNMQSLGAFNGSLPGAALYAGVTGLGFTGYCPEGSFWMTATQSCQCHPGRVWMPDKSKCVSPQSPAYQGAMNIQQVIEAGGGSDTFAQQDLSTAARRYIESKGHSIHCKITEDWFHGPQGGSPPMLCSVDGGPYEHGAYAVNLNPDLALLGASQQKAADIISATTGVPGGAISSTQVGQAELQKITDMIYRGGDVSGSEVSTAPIQHEMAKKATEHRQADADFAQQIQQGGYGSGSGYQPTGMAVTGSGEGMPGWLIPAAAAAAVVFFMKG